MSNKVQNILNLTKDYTADQIGELIKKIELIKKEKQKQN